MADKNNLKRSENLATYQLGLLQAKAYRTLNKHNGKVLKKYKLNTIEWTLLGSLMEWQEGLKPKDMAILLGVEPSFVSAMVRKLKDKKLVNESFSTRDKRAKYIKLENAGKRLINKIEADLSKKNDLLHHGLSLSDIFTYLKVLKIFVRNSSEG